MRKINECMNEYVNMWYDLEHIVAGSTVGLSAEEKR